MGFKNTIHVSGFPRGTRARDLAPDFEKIGKVVRIDIPPARSPYARPYAFVKFEDVQDAYEAVSQLDQQPFTLDPQFALLVQMARSEPHPSRLAGAPNPAHEHPAHGEHPQHYDYPSAPRGPRASTRRYDDRPPRRTSRDEVPRARGTYGSRAYNDSRMPELESRRRDLSPARTHTDGGPAPYHDISVRAVEETSSHDDPMADIQYTSTDRTNSKKGSPDVQSAELPKEPAHHEEPSGSVPDAVVHSNSPTTQYVKSSQVDQLPFTPAQDSRANPTSEIKSNDVTPSQPKPTAVEQETTTASSEYTKSIDSASGLEGNDANEVGKSEENTA